MKKIFSVLVLVAITNVLFAQTLFTFGSNAVDKAEFLKAYNKNKQATTDPQTSLKEYLDLYTKFKLKVKAAKDLGIDTLPQLQYDLQSFRQQVEQSYLNDDKSVDVLVTEAMERSQKDIQAFHFFIPLAADVSATDTLKAYTALTEVAKQLKEGKTDYAKIIENVTATTYKVQGGDLGFITAFTLPYEYENIIYKLKAGEVSTIYRSKKGLHIFKQLNERKSAGKWKIAQMLFAFAPDQNVTNAPLLKAKADSVYNLLKKGANFADLAKIVSDDKMSYMAGGELPEFGTGKFKPSFEQEIFDLKKDGDFTKVFATSFGYHIVKRLSQTPTPSDLKDVNFIADVKQRVQQDGRINTAKEKFAKNILTILGYKKSGVIKDEDLYKYADSFVAKTDADVSKFPITKKPIFNFGKVVFTGADWLTFIKEYRINGELYQGEKNAALYNKFVTTTAMDYYKKHLDEYNTDFKYQMNEFKEGNMLFEVMEKKVWSSASNDSAGLKNYYNANKAKYKWGNSATVILFNCNNKTTADKAIEDLKNGKDWKKIIEESNNTLQADSGRYELSQIPLPDSAVAKAGMVSTATVNAIDGSASFVKILQLYAANEQRNFDEAKGLIINDYQTIVEEKWIAELKKKYPIKINDAVFNSLLK